MVFLFATIRETCTPVPLVIDKLDYTNSSLQKNDSSLQKNDCWKLVNHLLVISLLEHKWTKFGQYIFFGNLIIYLIYLSDRIWSCCPVSTPYTIAILLRLCFCCCCCSCFLPLLAGIDVVNGSFNGTATENCEGRTVTELQLHLV